MAAATRRPTRANTITALMTCVGEPDIDKEVIGKPSPRLFDRACRALHVQAESAVMIGDNLATDIAGADAFGLRSILVGPRSEVGFEELLRNEPPASRRAAAG
jgi:4-nitrophenyl phosphatase